MDSMQRQAKISDRLNLGCGRFPKAGFVNVDISPLAKADVIHDLNIFPYPFPDGSFGYIESTHVLEHLGEPFLVMKELHRILRPGGQLRIFVPHFSRGFSHPDHKAGFDVTFPLFFQPAYPGFTGTEFTLCKQRIRWFGQLHFKRQMLPSWQYSVGRSLSFVFDLFAALSPLACSKIWCFWVGGFDELEFVFEKETGLQERCEEAN